MSAPSYLSACAIGGGFAAAALDAAGDIIWQCDLAARAHDVVADPAHDVCAVMGRKPGRSVSIRTLTDGKALLGLAPLPAHSFDGHAVFSADGAELLTTQSDDRTQAGRIAVYETASGNLLRQFSSHGTEPHEIIWAAPGLLAIGNGGILDRRSADAIDSSLALIDAEDGNLQRRWVLDDEWESLSIRHLAALPQGRFAFAMQDQDPATDRRPLVAIAATDGALEFLEIPAAIQRRLDGYIGSVAVDGHGTVIAATAPRGGLSLFWSVRDGRYLGEIPLPDVCGVAADTNSAFRLTSGHGAWRQARPDGDGRLALAAGGSDLALQWDNHLSRAL